MTEREREAAKNPRPGDRWRKTTKAGQEVSRTVKGVELLARFRWQNMVSYSTSQLGARLDPRCSLITWQAWCRGAELVERGDS